MWRDRLSLLLIPTLSVVAIFSLIRSSAQSSQPATPIAANNRYSLVQMNVESGLRKISSYDRNL